MAQCAAPMIADTKNQNQKNTNIIKNRQNTVTIINVSGGGAINFKT